MGSHRLPYRSPRKDWGSGAYSDNNLDYPSTTASGTSRRSQSSWGINGSAASIAFDSQSSASERVRNLPVSRNPLCRTCGERGHLARDCPSRAAVTSTFAASTRSNNQDYPVANASNTARVPRSPAPVGDLIDFTSTSDDEEKENDPDTSESKVANHLTHAKQWSELDQDSIRQKVKSEEAFHAPLAEESLIDGSLDEEAAREAADAMVPIQLQRKRKGKKKGKTWYNLTPFVNF